MRPKEGGGLAYEKINAGRLNGLLSGCQIVGAEPVDYPATDGITLYLEGKDGKRYILDAVVNIACVDGEPPEEMEGNYLELSAALVPEWMRWVEIEDYIE